MKESDRRSFFPFFLSPLSWKISSRCPFYLVETITKKLEINCELEIAFSSPPPFPPPRTYSSPSFVESGGGGGGAFPLSYSFFKNSSEKRIVCPSPSFRAPSPFLPPYHFGNGTVAEKDKAPNSLSPQDFFPFCAYQVWK